MSLRQIVLDESMENPPPAGFVVVETEIEVLLHDGAEKLWIRGHICNYVRNLYRARETKVTEIVSPRARLRSLLGGTADRIDSLLLSQLLKILDREQPTSIADLLFHFTHDDFWLADPSIEHAARFLFVELDSEISEVAEIQRNLWLTSTRDENLRSLYALPYAEREAVMHKWFFDEETRERLGEFPLKLSDEQSKFLSDEVGRNLRLSKGKWISKFPKQTANKKIYAEAAIEYFSHNATLLTSEFITQASPLLSRSQRAQLEGLL